MSPKNDAKRAIWLLMLNRLLINIPRRFPYVFLPPISQELGVTTASVQQVIATQSGVGVASPIFGSLFEQYGRKQVLMACLALACLMAAWGFVQPIFAVFAVITVGFGIVKMLFDPTLQAYIADRVAYRERGYAIGVTELSWAGSLVVVALVGGLILERWGVRGVMGGLAVLFGVGCLSVWWGLPPDERSESATETGRISPLMAWRVLRQSPLAMSALAYSLFLVTANEIIFINYSLWMEQSFRLTVTRLGAATIVIAAAEVLGEVVVIRGADRFGKRRLALGGVLVSSLLYCGLPFLDFHLAAALVGLFITFVGVEIAIVSSLSLFTEILPKARVVMMSSNVGAQALGRLLGGVVGGVGYSLTESFSAVGVLAMGIGLIAAALLYFKIHEQETPVTA